MSGHSIDQPDFNQMLLRDRIDAVCDRFEELLRDGKQPRIEDFLNETTEPDRSALLRELLVLEMAYRRRNAETPAMADYSPRFPGDTEVLCEVMARQTDADPDAFTRTDTFKGEHETPSAHSKPTELPERIGRYRVEKVLGEGDSGESIWLTTTT